jgi:hypothetical protein
MGIATIPTPVAKELPLGASGVVFEGWSNTGDYTHSATVPVGNYIAFASPLGSVNFLTLPNTLGKNEDVQSKILDELKKPTTKTFNNIRQIIADNDVSSFEDVFKHLYECTNDYAVGCEGQIAIIINECIYQSNFRVDLEINFMSAISRIIEVLKTNKRL